MLFRFVNSLWFSQYTVNHKYEAKEAYHRSYSDTAYAENIRFERGFCRAWTCHEQEADDDNYHACSQQNEVCFIECKVSFIHIAFLIDELLYIIKLSGFHMQIFVDRDESAECGDGYSEHEYCRHYDKYYFRGSYGDYVWLIVYKGVCHAY